MFSTLLIANRGEIACRIIRTAREMGIRTVVVYSDADAKALHVRQADEAIHIGPSPARESYLVGDKIIAAAKATGAEAIHPGYGFLSENAAFAQAVIDAGLIWVGPKPASIEAMGLKDAAKALMQAAGVPVTPGYMGANQDPAVLAEEAGKIGYPVLIKAVAGGGGKGMRLVEQAADFADALASCQREASASFGNAHVLIEKYILSPRHIEVQVFERDCSLQRRHQKVIEEAPAPGMDEATREAVCGAAVRAAQAVSYEGAGTIEFIADASEGLRADRIWFMEMNTRLQVEHPVTEEITGVDLVEWQLRVAAGEAIPLKQDELSINGWAMEARLYAEDPAKGFLPSTGPLDHLSLLDCDRIETGVAEGDAVSPFYDPMIAKLVCQGADRLDVLRKLALACEAVECSPVKTNAWFLARALTFPEFELGKITTSFIADNLDALTEAPSVSGELEQVIADLMCCDPETGKSSPPELRGFRLNSTAATAVKIILDGEARTVDLVMSEGELLDAGWERKPIYQDTAGNLTAFEGGATFRASPFRADGGTHHSAHDGDILSPMPGKVIAVEVSAGQAVTKGQKLLTLEAMKMEHTLVAPFDGVVAELSAVAGAQVQVEALLARIEAAE
jgi:3-methylcrotonyl-CoA carboxylase alpha subunit